MGRLMSRGKQYIQYVKFLYCKNTLENQCEETNATVLKPLTKFHFEANAILRTGVILV